MTETICEKCGVSLTQGMWPFCPHPLAGSVQIETDEIPGGITLENYSKDPMTFYSHSERRRYMQAQGLQEKEKFCPLPGSSKDPQGIPNPAGYLDPKTLDNARVLISRNGSAKDEEWDPVVAGVLTDLQTGTITERDARAIVEGDPTRASRFHRRTANGRT